MKDTLLNLSHQYEDALQAYLSGSGEQALQRAYELGREAINAGLGVLDIAAVYQHTLFNVLLRTVSREESTTAARSAADFFMESLSPFEMAQRGYQDANATLAWLNETLDRRKRADDERKRLLSLEQSARAAAEAAQHRLAFLAEASILLDASLDYEATLNNLAKITVPYLADWCLVDIGAEGGGVRRVAAVHADLHKTQVATTLHDACDEFNELIGIPEVLISGRSRLVSAVSENVLGSSLCGNQLRDTLSQLGFKSYMIVPLVARHRILGAVTLVAGESGRRYERDDLAFAEDLARRSAIAVDNARLYAQAQRAIEARDEMLSIVSHDLRNPLGVVLMSAMILIKNADTLQLPQQQRDQLEAIKRSAERMNLLIRDLLDVSRIEGGRLRIERHPFEVRELVSEAVDHVALLARRKHQSLETSVECGDVRVFADRERVFQIFSNLIGNAIKFTPDGGQITVSATNDGDFVEFVVSDTGPGIPSEHLPHVFDRFWQAKHTARMGTGLGLTIARGIAEAHGGRIWVESEPGSGSRFHFTLPVFVSQEATAQEHA